MSRVSTNSSEEVTLKCTRQSPAARIARSRAFRWLGPAGPYPLLRQNAIALVL